jgi:hypothetical protein
MMVEVDEEPVAACHHEGPSARILHDEIDRLAIVERGAPVARLPAGHALLHVDPERHARVASEQARQLRLAMKGDSSDDPDHR